MKDTCLMIMPILFPIIAGILLLAYPKVKKRKNIITYTAVVLFTTAALVIWNLVSQENPVTLFWLTDKISIGFKIDEISKLFVSIVTIVWILAGIHSFVYMKHEENEKRYFGFYLIVYGVLIGLDFAGNLITFYMFYEFMTLMSFPLVIHTRSKEAIMAGLKYLFYSFAGAYMVLFGIYFLFRYAPTLDFIAGGSLDLTSMPEKTGLFLVVAFLMIMGFSVKAGMFPMHAWLPSAHPVAPSPASAALSGIIVKSGVLGIIRAIYYVIGAEFIRGTWVQNTWMILALITVFMGSMLAYREKVLKKRLAYSTVSQISYILLGLAVLAPDGFTGGLLHTCFHAFIKCGLFLVAGAIIYNTGATRVEELKGIGKKMPLTLWCFTFLSLALIGIPPASGFISKWYLCVGALNANVGIYGYLIPVILLISALLTAGYLLPITINGFFPGEDFKVTKGMKKESPMGMLIPIAILAILAVILGVFPNELIAYISKISQTVLI